MDAQKRLCDDLSGARVSLDWSAIAADVLSVVQELGQDVTLTSVSAAGNYDADTATAAPAETAATRRAAVVPYPPGQTQVLGKSVEAGDRRCLMEAALGGEPTVRDSVACADGTFGILTVQKIAPGGVAVAYDIHLRAN